MCIYIKYLCFFLSIFNTETAYAFEIFPCVSQGTESIRNCGISLDLHEYYSSIPEGQIISCGNISSGEVSRALIQYKMLSYQYRKLHCGDKTVERLSYLHNGIFYTGKMTSLY